MTLKFDFLIDIDRSNFLKASLQNINLRKEKKVKMMITITKIVMFQ